jgi:hypothetical protein
MALTLPKNPSLPDLHAAFLQLEARLVKLETDYAEFVETIRQRQTANRLVKLEAYALSNRLLLRQSIAAMREIFGSLEQAEVLVEVEETLQGMTVGLDPTNG